MYVLTDMNNMMTWWLCICLMG